jgi:putative endonuclease
LERTSQQVAGDAAEELVAGRLVALGWRVLGRNVHVGRSELDIVAVDPGPPARLVIVEVRWRRSRAFGLPEETFDYKKRAHLRAGVGRLLEAGCLPGGVELPRLPVALDLAVVEPGPVVRLHRDALS